MPEEDPQPAPQSQVTVGTKSHDWKKVSLTILVILVVSGLIVAAYWFLVLNKSSDDSDLTGPVPKVTVPKATESAKEATESAERDETADWKTYTDKVLGFQVKYPNDWFVDPAESWTKATEFNGGSVTDITNFDKNKITNPGSLKEGQYKITIGKHTKVPNQSILDYVTSKRLDCCPPLTYEELESKKLGDFFVYQNISHYKDGPTKEFGTVSTYIEINKTTVYVITGFLARGQYESDLDLIVSSLQLL